MDRLFEAETVFELGEEIRRDGEQIGFAKDGVIGYGNTEEEAREDWRRKSVALEARE